MSDICLENDKLFLCIDDELNGYSVQMNLDKTLEYKKNVGEFKYKLIMFRKFIQLHSSEENNSYIF